MKNAAAEQPEQPEQVSIEQARQAGLEEPTTIAEGSQRAGVHPNTVRRLLRTGKLRGHLIKGRHGDTWLVDAAQLDQLMAVPRRHGPLPGYQRVRSTDHDGASDSTLDRFNTFYSEDLRVTEAERPLDRLIPSQQTLIDPLLELLRQREQALEAREVIIRAQAERIGRLEREVELLREVLIQPREPDDTALGEPEPEDGRRLPDEAHQSEPAVAAMPTASREEAGRPSWFAETATEPEVLTDAESPVAAGQPALNSLPAPLFQPARWHEEPAAGNVKLALPSDAAADDAASTTERVGAVQAQALRVAELAGQVSRLRQELQFLATSLEQGDPPADQLVPDQPMVEQLPVAEQLAAEPPLGTEAPVAESHEQPAGTDLELGPKAEAWPTPVADVPVSGEPDIGPSNTAEPSTEVLLMAEPEPAVTPEELAGLFPGGRRRMRLDPLDPPVLATADAAAPPESVQRWEEAQQGTPIASPTPPAMPTAPTVAPVPAGEAEWARQPDPFAEAEAAVRELQRALAQPAAQDFALDSMADALPGTTAAAEGPLAPDDSSPEGTVDDAAEGAATATATPGQAEKDAKRRWWQLW